MKQSLAALLAGSIALFTVFPSHASFAQELSESKIPSTLSAENVSSKFLICPTRPAIILPTGRESP